MDLNFIVKLSCIAALCVMPLHAILGGILIVSGNGGHINYRVEYSEELSNDWIKTPLDADGLATIVFNNHEKNDVWLTLTYTNALMNRSFFTEVYLTSTDTVEMEFFEHPDTNIETLGVMYVRHPDLENQLCYDYFTNDSPFNHVNNFFLSKEKDIVEHISDVNYLPDLIEDQLFSKYMDCGADAAVEELSPYRIRMLYRFCGTTCDLLSDETLLTSLSLVDRERIVSAVLSRFPPADLGKFHGRFWSNYLSIGCAVLTLEKGALASQRIIVHNAVFEKCNFELPWLRDIFFRLFDYEQEVWFEYLMAEQIQTHLEIFTKNPEFYSAHLALFKCLFPESKYTAKLDSYFD